MNAVSRRHLLLAAAAIAGILGIVVPCSAASARVATPGSTPVHGSPCLYMLACPQVTSQVVDHSDRQSLWVIVNFPMTFQAPVVSVDVNCAGGQHNTFTLHAQDFQFNQNTDTGVYGQVLALWWTIPTGAGHRLCTVTQTLYGTWTTTSTLTPSGDDVVEFDNV